VNSNDSVAIWISAGSLAISAFTFLTEFRRGRRIRVSRPALVNYDGEAGFMLIVRNPGAVPVQLTGWGLRVSGRLIGQNYSFHSNVAGASDLNAPDSIPCDLQPSSYVRLSCKVDTVRTEYDSAHHRSPKRVRGYVEVGWRKSIIKSLFRSRWPK
jgi:hypothetical protein